MGQDFHGLEYTEVRISRVKRLIESSERKLVELRTSLVALEAKKTALLAQQKTTI